MNQRYIYIVITRTQTKFAKSIRILGRMKYNHASIGLDADLKELYAFSRPSHGAIFQGRLVRETLNRYTLKKDCVVPVAVFQLPVTDEQYHHIHQYVDAVYNDPEYIYNLFCVLTYPFTHGFPIRKAFNCSEFVAHILKGNGFALKLPEYRYRPDDLTEVLKDYMIFEGDLRDYMKCKDIDETYFNHLGFVGQLQNLWALFRIIGRTYFSLRT